MRKPKVGEKFNDVDQLKECLTYYALANGFSLWLYRSSNTQLIARCGLRPEKLKDTEKGKQRKWKRYPSTDEVEGASCPFRCYAKEMTDEKSFQLHEIADLVMKKYKCIVSPAQCRNAKRWALNEGETTMEDPLWRLVGLRHKLFGANPGSNRLGCRKVIALDGCFLKKPSVGEILAAIGRDANNHIYPVAWAVGLIEAVKEVMPYAEHRQCARHIYEGFRKLYSGVEFRRLFWAASKASYPRLFNKIMSKIKTANPNAYEYLLKKDPKSCSCYPFPTPWVTSYRVRNKPLITMLEAMRVIVLERMNTMRRVYDTWTEDICPNIQKRLELTKDLHRFWHVIPTGGQLFEVRNGSQAFGVDEKRRTCTCRLWQLSGLPCPHAIAVIFKLNRRAEEYVPTCFRKQSFHDSYHQYLTPVGGMSFWPDCSDMSKVLPPKARTMPGRPKKKRIRAFHENKNTNRVSRSGITMTCSNCFQKGHNKTSCQNETVVLPPKPPCKKGRPRKIQLGVEEQVVDEPHDAPVVEGEHSSPLESDPVEDSGNAMFEATQNSHIATNIAFAGTQGSQTTNQHVADQEPVANQLQQAAPRQRSERILKRKLAKKVGSGNAMFEATQNSHIATNIAFAGTQGSQTTNQHVADQDLLQISSNKLHQDKGAKEF
ncbi:pentatricopeptide repeat-containing protein [Tanacetum coccineum]